MKIEEAEFLEEEEDQGEISDDTSGIMGDRYFCEEGSCMAISIFSDGGDDNTVVSMPMVDSEGSVASPCSVMEAIQKSQALVKVAKTEPSWEERCKLMQIMHQNLKEELRMVRLSEQNTKGFVEELKTALQKSISENDEISVDMMGLIHKCEKLQAKNKQLDEDNKHWKKEHRKLSSALESLVKQVEDKGSEWERLLGKKKARWNDERKALEDEIARLRKLTGTPPSSDNNEQEQAHQKFDTDPNGRRRKLSRNRNRTSQSTIATEETQDSLFKDVSDTKSTADCSELTKEDSPSEDSETPREASLVLADARYRLENAGLQDSQHGIGSCQELLTASSSSHGIMPHCSSNRSLADDQDKNMTIRFEFNNINSKDPQDKQIIMIETGRTNSNTRIVLCPQNSAATGDPKPCVQASKHLLTKFQALAVHKRRSLGASLRGALRKQRPREEFDLGNALHISNPSEHTVTSEEINQIRQQLEATHLPTAALVTESIDS